VNSKILSISQAFCLENCKGKNFLCDSTVESYLYISFLLHYALLTLTCYGMKPRGKGVGR